MMRKVRALWALMQVGKVVADPAWWKARQIESSMVIAALWGLIHAAEAFGWEFPAGGETVDAIAVGLLATVNLVLTLTSSDKVGLPPKPGADKP